jgi:hypothetical protein
MCVTRVAYRLVLSVAVYAPSSKRVVGCDSFCCSLCIMSISVSDGMLFWIVCFGQRVGRTVNSEWLHARLVRFAGHCDELLVSIAASWRSKSFKLKRL